MSKAAAPNRWQKFFPTVFAEGRHVLPGLNDFLHPESLDAETVRRWLLSRSASLKISLSQWAKLAGLAPSTVNRFVKSQGPANLSATTISALAKVLKQHWDEAAQKDFVPPKSRMSVTVPVIGAIDPGNFRSHFEWDEAEDFEIRVPIPIDYIGPPSFGFEIRGEMFHDLPANTIVFGTPFHLPTQTKLVPDGASIVCHRWVGDGQFDTTLKKLKKDPDGDAWLVSKAINDRERAIFANDIAGHGADGDEHFASFHIIGRVASEPGIFFRKEPWLEKD